MDVCAALDGVSRGQLHGLRVQVRDCTYSSRHGLCCRLCFHREGQREHGVDRCELQVLIRNPLAKLKAPDLRSRAFCLRFLIFPLKWSDLKYAFWHQGGRCRGSITSPKRSSRSYGRSMCLSRKGRTLSTPSARSE